MFEKPTVADFKNHFSRDFPYNSDPALGVTDLDIERAMLEAEVSANLELARDQSQFTLFYLYATAHFLVMDLRAAMQGMNGSYQWMTSGKSVGSVSESYAIPSLIQENPLYAMWFKTNYGAKFMQMLMPLLTAPIFSVKGRTKP